VNQRDKENLVKELVSHVSNNLNDIRESSNSFFDLKKEDANSENQKTKESANRFKRVFKSKTALYSCLKKLLAYLISESVVASEVTPEKLPPEVKEYLEKKEKIEDSDNQKMLAYELIDFVNDYLTRIRDLSDNFYVQMENDAEGVNDQERKTIATKFLLFFIDKNSFYNCVKTIQQALISSPYNVSEATHADILKKVENYWKSKITKYKEEFAQMLITFVKIASNEIEHECHDFYEEKKRKVENGSDKEKKLATRFLQVFTDEESFIKCAKEIKESLKMKYRDTHDTLTPTAKEFLRTKINDEKYRNNFAERLVNFTKEYESWEVGWKRYYQMMINEDPSIEENDDHKFAKSFIEVFPDKENFCETMQQIESFKNSSVLLYQVQINPATTDNFGNRLVHDTAYIPVIMAYAEADAQPSPGAFENQISNLEKTSEFTYCVANNEINSYLGVNNLFNKSKN
jgi:hypothetical protein